MNDLNKNTPPKKKNVLVGQVVSDKADRTISVEVYRLVKHAKYRKYLKKRSKFKAHDEKNESSVGDTVRIFETRPLSKTKRWKLLEIVKHAKKEEEL